MAGELIAELVRTCPTCGRAESPDPIDLVRQLREALGMFAGAMPISPKQAWEEALDVARRLAEIPS